MQLEHLPVRHFEVEMYVKEVSNHMTNRCTTNKNLRDRKTRFAKTPRERRSQIPRKRLLTGEIDHVYGCKKMEMGDLQLFSRMKCLNV